MYNMWIVRLEKFMTLLILIAVFIFYIFEPSGNLAAQ